MSLITYAQKLTLEHRRTKDELTEARNEAKKFETMASKEDERALALEQENERLRFMEPELARLVRLEKRMPEINHFLKLIPKLSEYLTGCATATYSSLT